MLALMNSVALLDEQSSIRDVEKMTRLAVENKVRKKDTVGLKS